MGLLGVLVTVSPACAASSLAQSNPDADMAMADMVLVSKSQRRLYLLREDRILKSYPVALGGDPEGHKQREGDSRTPEGRYEIDYKNPNSKFHLALHVSYPNAHDRRVAQELGVSPGGDIMIHGLPNGYSWAGFVWKNMDWTDGCIAVNNEAIREIWAAVDPGTPIYISP